MLAVLPRPGLPHGKSGTVDYPDNYRAKMLAWRETAKSEAIYGLESNKEYQEIERYIDWLEGVQWDPARPKYRSKFYDNRMMQARIQNLSSLTNIRPALDVSSSVKEYAPQCKVVDSLLRAEWTRQNFDIRTIEVVDHALFNTGFWKIGASLPGRLFVTACGCDEVLPIQMGKGGIQNSQGVLYRAFKALPYFQETFGERAAGVERQSVNHMWAITNNRYQKPMEISEYTWNIMSPAMRYRMSLRNGSISTALRADMPSFPIIELEEYWIDDPSYNDFGSEVLVKHPDLSLQEHSYHYRVPPGRRLFPRKRLVVFGGDVVVYDGPSPYWDGLYPFAMLQLNPVVWSPGGISLYRQLLPLCMANNEIGAGILDAVKKAINPQMLSKRGAVDGNAWRNFFADLPGAKLQLTPVGNVMTDVRYMDPPNIPGYVAQFLQHLLGTIHEYSGALDVGGLKGKKQVPGADVIEQMRDSMSAGFNLESRYIEAFLRDAGAVAVPKLFQHYTLPQRLRILGSNGQTWEDYDFEPNYMTPWSMPKEDHWKSFSVQIAPGSLLGAQQDRKRMMAFALRKDRDISRKGLFRAIDWPDNADQNEQELKAEVDAGTYSTGGGRSPRMNRSSRNGNPM